MPDRTVARVPPEDFEERYRRHADPWGFATSPYELEKYARTVAALEGARHGRALELGCAIGVLTERLAPSCASLTAIDASPTAVGRARSRTSGLPHVDVRVATLPEDLPSGRWDLVVASEVLYYFDDEVLDDLLHRLEAALDPGGTLLAVHFTEDAPDHRQSGDAVHGRLLRREALHHAGGERRPRYRLDRFTRR